MRDPELDPGRGAEEEGGIWTLPRVERLPREFPTR